MSVGARRAGGVYRGWWVVSAPFLAAALNTGAGQYGFGVFVPPLVEEFGWSRTQIYSALSFTAVGSLLAPLIGSAIDRYGAKPAMVVSLAAIAASFFARPLMSELWHWYALSFLQYVGYSGAAMMCAGKLVGMWFRRRRGRAMGLTAMGNNFGGIFMPPLMGFILVMRDWQSVFVALGAMSVGLVFYSFATIRDFPSAEELGDEFADDSGRAAGSAAPPPAMTGLTMREALRGRAFYALAATVTLGFFTYSAVIPSIIPHLTEIGASIRTATISLSVYAVMGMVGKFVMGLLAERITSRRALMVNFAGQAALVTAMALASGPVALWVVVPILGFFNGAFGALFQLAALDVFGVRRFGGIMGLINMLSAAAFVIGPLMIGASFDFTGDYAAMLLATAAMFAAAILALTQAQVKECIQRERRRRLRSRKRKRKNGRRRYLRSRRLSDRRLGWRRYSRSRRLGRMGGRWRRARILSLGHVDISRRRASLRRSQSSGFPPSRE